MCHIQPYVAIFLALCAVTNCALAEIYYVTPSSTTPCPEESVPCFTLSQYAAKPSHYFASDTTLILLPGNHTLDTVLSIQDITAVSVETNLANEMTQVTCSQPGNFMFEHISGNVSIRGLELFGCMNNRITSVEHFALEYCSLDGQGRDGTGLILNEVAFTIIERCSFSSYTGMDLTQLIGILYVQRAGGSIIASNSESITISNTVFTNNSIVSSFLGSRYGGALFSYYSTVALNNCTFKDNSIDGSGGAMFAYESMVTINKSSFVNNSGVSAGAVSMSYCNTTINKSNFTKNVGTYGSTVFFVHSTNSVTNIKNTKFTSNLALPLRNIPIQAGICGALCASSGGTIILRGCTFSNNSISEAVPEGQGGAIYLLSVHNSSIHNTTFDKNVVAGGNGEGGVVYMYGSNCTLSSCTLLSNKASTGAILYAKQSTVYFTKNNTISNNYGSIFTTYCNVTFLGYTIIANNSYSSNTSQEGGALTSFQGEIDFAGSAEMINNTAALYGGAISVAQSKLYIRFHGNVTITNNTASTSGGGIYAYQSELNFIGNTNISNNSAGEMGGGIHAISSIMRFTDGPAEADVFTGDPNGSKTLIDHNHSKRGGGVYLELNSKLYIDKIQLENNGTSNPDTWLMLQFTENNAEYGGAIYIADDTNSCYDTRAISNECFFQAFYLYLLNSLGIFNINIRNIYFTNNFASVAGSILYGGLLDRCTVSPLAEYFFKYTTSQSSPDATLPFILNTTNIEIEDLNSTEMISSDPVRICFCKHNRPDCSYQHQTMYVKRGQSFNVSLVAVDQINNTIAKSIVHGVSSPTASLGEGESVQNTNTDGSCTELSYTILSPHKSEQLFLYAEGPCNSIGISKRTISVSIASCPIGFGEINLRCDCDNVLRDYITNCSIDTQSVQRKGNAWFSYVNTTAHPENYIYHQHCPSDYCKPSTEDVFVNLNIPNGSDALCAFNRSGKLCGSCEDGLSLSLGSSHCKQCSNNWLALLVVFAIAGVALVAFLLVFNLTVAVGSINGLIFYANIIAANSAILLPFDKPNILTVFIAWLSLDFGFETCFYDGMDAYAKTWLQLVFPTYVIVLVAMVIFISHYSWRFSRLLSNRNPVATLATLILLSYTKLVRMIIASLSFAILNYSDTSQEEVWLVDANVLYLKGKHIPLFVAALIILIGGVTYSFFLFFWQWLLRCPDVRALKWIRSTKLNSFMDAYCAPYTPRHRYWTGLLLLARALLYTVLALNLLGDPAVNLFTINCVAGSLLVLMAIFKVYKSWPLTVIETSFFFNLTFFSAALLYNKQTNNKDNTLYYAYTSLSIAFITFVAILAFHVHTYVFGKALEKVIRRFYKEKRNHSETRNGIQNLIDPQIHCFNEIREPLLELTESNIDSHCDRNNSKEQKQQHKHTSVTYSVVDGP